MLRKSPTVSPVRMRTEIESRFFQINCYFFYSISLQTKECTTLYAEEVLNNLGKWDFYSWLFPLSFLRCFLPHEHNRMWLRSTVWLLNISVDQQGIVVCDSHSYNILHESIQRNPTQAAGVSGNNGNYYFILSERKVNTILF